MVVALWIALTDRRDARREARERWELDLLTELAVLTTHGGYPQDAPPEVKAAEADRHARRLVLRWMLGGPKRFPIGMRADQLKNDTVSELERVRDDPESPELVRRQVEATVVAIRAAEDYHRRRS